MFRWSAEDGQYLPVPFTNDRGEDQNFLFVDAKSPVALNKNGSIEVKVERVDQSGRKATFIERYRWESGGYHYTEDH